MNEAYPMRGHLVFPRCGKNLTGSSGEGNGGKYYYYHCTKGCKERHKSDSVHNAFESWLGEISTEPEIATLYMAIMEEAFKTNEGDREVEKKKIEAALEKNRGQLHKATTKLLDDEIDRNDFNRVKDRVARESLDYQKQISDLKAAGSGNKDYCRCGISLLSNMNCYNSGANLENRQKMLGLIFPEKLVCNSQTFQTMQPSEILDLPCNTGKGFGGGEKALSSENAAQCFLVTALGFKPKTPSSVVRYSIQLSYAAFFP